MKGIAHHLLEARVEIQIALIWRERNSIRESTEVLVGNRQSHVAVLYHVDAVEGELLARTLATSPQPEIAVGEVHHAVGPDDHIIGSVETLPLELRRQHRSVSVRLETVDRLIRRRTPYESALRVDSLPVGADHEHVHAPAARLRACVGDVISAVARLVQENGDLSAGIPSIDDVG